MKTILLIEVGARYTPYPPIGIMHIASVLRGKYGVVIKDYSGKEINENEIKRDIEKSDAFIVGLRVLTGPPIPRAIKISKIAKRLGKIVVWGGPHPTVLPEQTLENKNVDAVVIGEGELTFQTLIKYFEGEKVKLEGVGIKKNGKIMITGPSKKSVDLDKMPMPAWDLVDNINRYFPEKKHNEIPISTTRGCAFKCGFCHNSNKNVKSYLGCYRLAHPKKAIEEYKFVQDLVKNNIDVLNVGEDLHLVSEAYTKKFCNEMRESGRKLSWYTASRYQTLNKEIIDLIAKTNCTRMLLGVESGSERIQKMNNKVIEFNRSIKIAKYLRKKKIFLTNAYILGHPTETTEELQKTIKFIKQIPADENLIQLYRPMPGTPYFQICVSQGKVEVPEKLEDWGGFGVLGHDVNVSKVPDKILFSSFYQTNAWQQTKFLFNQERFYLSHGMYSQFWKYLLNNRFTFKLKEYLAAK